MNVNLNHVNGMSSNLKLTPEDKRTQQGIQLGVGSRLIAATPTYRATSTDKGMCLYYRSAQCGLAIPFGSFVIGILGC